MENDPSVSKTTATTGSQSPSYEDLSRQVDTLKADIRRLTDSLGSYGKAKGRYYQGEAQRRADHFRDEAQGKADEIEAYVHENPATALGIAAAIGLLLGLLSRR